MVEEEEDVQLLSAILPLEGCGDVYGSVDEFKEDLNEAELSVQEFKRGRVLWRRVSGTDENIQQNIITFLQEFASSIYFYNDNYLVQFWAPEEVVDEKGRHSCLTTSAQPFALIGMYSLKKGYFWYRKQSREHHVLLDDEADNVTVGPIGRAFRNGQPEYSPDLRLYSTFEHPLRDHAARCGLRSYLVLPLFHRSRGHMMNQSQYCLGVLELASFDAGGIPLRELERLDRALEAAGLRSTHTNICPIRKNPKYYEAEATSEIKEMLEVAIEQVPQLHLAQVWVDCKQCAASNLGCMERSAFITSRSGGKINFLGSCNWGMSCFIEAQELVHNAKAAGKGLAGRLLLSSSCLLCWNNVCDFSISEYPLSHHAQKAGLSSCFAVCLRMLPSKAQNRGNYHDFCFVEFFFHKHCHCRRESDMLQHLSLSITLGILLGIMELKLRGSFEFASVKQRGGGEEVVLLEKDMQLGCDISTTHQLMSSQSGKQHIHRFSRGLITRRKMSVVVMDPENDSSLPSKLMDCSDLYTTDEFKEYLKEPHLCWSQPPPPRLKPPRWLFFGRPVPDCETNNNPSTNIQKQVQESKILSLLMTIAFDNVGASYFIAQYWASSENGSCLTTYGQPFAVGSLCKGLCWYREQCMLHNYYICSQGEAAEGERVGPPGRAFRNGHPESTPDLRLYSKAEFPLRHDAVHCGLSGYAVFPVFELNQQHDCIGVLEFATSSYLDLHIIEIAFEKAALRTTHLKFQRGYALRLEGSLLQGITA